MAEELGTRDVFEQVDARLGNVEQDVRDVGSQVRSGFDRLDAKFERLDGRFERIDTRFESQTRWLVGVVMASWLTIMASIWLKG